MATSGARAMELIAFLGPSLPRAEAERELRAVASASNSPPLVFSLEPPAQQGDVWRALARRPRALALIDGVFESAPSVWHHELLDALDAGVIVFGAASMGALRASELSSRGMIGVGEIFRRYRDGLDDDAAVALLHASAEHGFAPLTVPLVNALHAIDAAARAAIVSAAEARRLRASAGRLHYQERRWEAVLAGARLGAAARARWESYAAVGFPDLKADDARSCLREAARAALAQRANPLRPRAPRSPPPSSRVRVRRAAQLSAHAESPSEKDEFAAQKILFIAAAARLSGASPGAELLAATEARLFAGLGAAAREALLRRAGIAEDELRRLIETLALEALALEHAARMLPDGPSPIEATRLAQLLGALAPRRR